MSEAEAGSDVLSMRLAAEWRGDRYVLNGTKMWITNGPGGDLLVVYARTGRRHHGLSGRDLVQGLLVAQKLDKLGMRGSPTGELVFTDCEVPDENVLGEVGRGVGVLMSGSTTSASCSRRAARHRAGGARPWLPYSRERRQFGVAIGSFQLVQGKLADMYAASTPRAYVYAVAGACDRGETTRRDAAGAILLAAETATRIALDAVQLLGGNGYINEFPAGRLLRDAKLYEIGAGTSEIRRWLIGRELVGEV